MGATIVVLNENVNMEDLHKFLKQKQTCKIPVCKEMLKAIFEHSSELHDGAIFIQKNWIVACKAFFRVTGEMIDTPNIG